MLQQLTKHFLHQFSLPLQPIDTVTIQQNSATPSPLSAIPQSSFFSTIFTAVSIISRSIIPFASQTIAIKQAADLNDAIADKGSVPT
jgi:hypothetical protein